MVSYYSGGGGQSAHGNWVNVTNGYLGLQFQIDRKTHYGWARFSVKVLKTSLRIQAVLTGYAYEDVPNTPIIAGRTSGTDAEEMPQSLNAPAAEPTMLGMLAMGSSGLSMWRRESEEGTK